MVCLQFHPSGGFVVLLASGVKLQTFADLRSECVIADKGCRDPKNSGAQLHLVDGAPSGWLHLVDGALGLQVELPASPTPWAPHSSALGRLLGMLRLHRSPGRRGREGGSGIAGCRSRALPFWEAAESRGEFECNAAEGAGSDLGQPREGLPQCRGRLKGSSNAGRVDSETEEVPRVRAASMLSPLKRLLKPEPEREVISGGLGSQEQRGSYFKQRI
ncbi:uncharacterized protein [Macaca nemestrina]|uniref:uncharacterized protein n=1 Tax=Macaca nemestrina TaxID=9545 RepID=UPI0039B9C50A